MSTTIEDNDLLTQRRLKLDELRKIGIAYPNNFCRTALANELHEQYGDQSHDALESTPLEVKVAGRMMLRRLMGKASFVVLQDVSGKIQLYVQAEQVGADVYDAFLRFDIGDILGAEGNLFKTKTGELSIKVKSLSLLTKSLRPLPDKFHGLADQELRYRQRYVDLMMNPETREIFRIRSKLVNTIRQFLSAKSFMEVETPMMHPIPGGAIARPFVTYHNTLDMPLYLRIAPELYLKRLVVGGFERVFELNRSFRNEGVSTRHNPEFTMLELYQAYATYEDLMELTEALLLHLAEEISGSHELLYQGQTINFAGSFTRMTVKEAILRYNSDIDSSDLQKLSQLKLIAQRLEAAFHPQDGVGKILMAIFEKTCESHLQQPTFITAYPLEVSPLARCNDEDPSITDRFELYIGGREIANGFSELNDAQEQSRRFVLQAEEKAAGDEEAMHYDADYITALEYGLPPTAGEGIGIDRLAMLFTNSSSIRDVLLFPQMRLKETL
jgi:lysyl-tRNA synthetase, class II